MVVIDLYLEMGDWPATRSLVVDENRLQMRTANASQRICREVISRLRLLTPEELALISEGDRQERQYLLWLAICKRYRFIHDFATDVLNDKFRRLDETLTHADYDVFFSGKAEWHHEVERIADSTRYKQRQVIFKMMNEAGLLSEGNRIIPALLSPRLMRAIGQDAPTYFAIYPAPEPALKEWLA